MVSSALDSGHVNVWRAMMSVFGALAATDESCAVVPRTWGHSFARTARFSLRAPLCRVVQPRISAAKPHALTQRACVERA
eukprot:1523396-Pleurochrysis_carterae.AAC.1